MVDKSLVDSFVEVFKTNKYTYEANQPIEILRNKIQFLINEKGFLDFKYNLTGNLYSDNSFRLSRRMGLIVINSGRGGPPVKISGKLIKKKDNQTSIEIHVKPNFVMVFLPIVFGLIGIGALFTSIITWNKETLIGGCFLIVVPMFWGMLKYTKSYYKSEFERALDLSKSERIEGEERK